MGRAVNKNFIGGEVGDWKIVEYDENSGDLPLHGVEIWLGDPIIISKARWFISMVPQGPVGGYNLVHGGPHVLGCVPQGHTFPFHMWKGKWEPGIWDAQGQVHLL